MILCFKFDEKSPMPDAFESRNKKFVITLLVDIYLFIYLWGVNGVVLINYIRIHA